MFSHNWVSLWRTSLTPQVWVYASQALTKPYFQTYSLDKLVAAAMRV